MNRDWLENLERTPGAYGELLKKSGSVVRAAHVLATARRNVYSICAPVPDYRELHRAAREIASRSDYIGSLPNKLELAQQAAAMGLLVIMKEIR